MFLMVYCPGMPFQANKTEQTATKKALIHPSTATQLHEFLFCAVLLNLVNVASI